MPCRTRRLASRVVADGFGTFKTNGTSVPARPQNRNIYGKAPKEFDRLAISGKCGHPR